MIADFQQRYPDSTGENACQHPMTLKEKTHCQQTFDEVQKTSQLLSQLRLHAQNFSCQ